MVDTTGAAAFESPTGHRRGRPVVISFDFYGQFRSQSKTSNRSNGMKSVVRGVDRFGVRMRLKLMPTFPRAAPTDNRAQHKVLM